MFQYMQETFSNLFESGYQDNLDLRQSGVLAVEGPAERGLGVLAQFSNLDFSWSNRYLARSHEGASLNYSQSPFHLG